MTARLANQVAIVTGATSGIGRATALLFAREGASLILTGRRRELGEAVRKECARFDIPCLFIAADHTRAEDCETVVSTALRELGTVDVLFNNAGVVTRGTALTTDESTWRRTWEINVTATWRMCRLVIPHMRARGKGAIVNNGSDWSVVGGENALSYVASKGAIAAMTKAMALDHATDGIRVNAVCPGDTLVDRLREQIAHRSPGADAPKDATAHVPMRRFATPEEIAQAVLFLACDAASFITGHLLLVDGGHTAR
ncbi:MAG TPA: SDR family oxidoreductase [Steroidobacter sp.]|nr:SDR family oxidoreductase [Steroidobacter sp.]